MKHLFRILITLFLLAMPGLSAGVSARPASAAPVYTCFPTCSSTDGRFLGLAGTGLQTLSGDSILIEIAVPSSRTTFELGIFDGETGGYWDIGTTPSVYTLYADPLADGTGATVVGTLPYASMLDNAWATFSFPTTAAAMALSGNYFYYLKVVNSNYSVASENSFKVRADASIEIQPQAFSFIASLNTLNDAKVIYPSYPALTPTTYDGNWDFYMAAPVPATSFAVWDGDMDFGSYNCSVNDTNDLDTPGAPYLPPWAVGTSAVPEGVAVSSVKCSSGTGYTTGNPPDDVSASPSILVRPPAITYKVTLPDGTTYQNANPSGNLEWEQFKISSNAADVPLNADYAHAGLLPAGTYQVHINGMDLHNLNAWRFFYPVLGVCDNGTPCVPVPPPSSPPTTGGKTIGFWQNKNGQGIISGGASTSGVCNSDIWLRQYAPFQDLSATATCAQVATYVYNVIKAANAGGTSMNPMLKAQMLATALNVYFGDPALGGNKIGASGPIGGSTINLTKMNASAAFGGAASMTVAQLLTYAASQSNVGGSTWYGNVKATQGLAKDVFDAINNDKAIEI